MLQFPPLPPPSQQCTPADAYECRQGAAAVWAEQRLVLCLLWWIAGQMLGWFPIVIYGWNRLDAVELEDPAVSISTTVSLILIYTFAIAFAVGSCAFSTFLVYRYAAQVARGWLAVTTAFWLTNATEAVGAIAIWQLW